MGRSGGDSTIIQSRPRIKSNHQHPTVISPSAATTSLGKEVSTRFPGPLEKAGKLVFFRYQQWWSSIWPNCDSYHNSRLVAQLHTLPLYGATTLGWRSVADLIIETNHITTGVDTTPQLDRHTTLQHHKALVWIYRWHCKMSRYKVRSYTSLLYQLQKLLFIK